MTLVYSLSWLLVSNPHEDFLSPQTLQEINPYFPVVCFSLCICALSEVLTVNSCLRNLNSLHRHSALWCWRTNADRTRSFLPLCSAQDLKHCTEHKYSSYWSRVVDPVGSFCLNCRAVTYVQSCIKPTIPTVSGGKTQVKITRGCWNGFADPLYAYFKMQEILKLGQIHSYELQTRIA